MADSPRALRVAKIGGSLLGLDDLKQRIEDWQLRQTPATTIWIVGGGKAVEEIRRQDECSELNAEDVHWSCIKKMDDNAQRVASWFPGWISFDRFDGLDVGDPPANLILSPLSWTRQHASHLPNTWNVTSDSIAATLANWIGASELVLLKSANPPTEAGIEAAISREFIDGYFLQAVNACDVRARTGTGYSVRVVNMRSASFQETVWA